RAELTLPTRITRDAQGIFDCTAVLSLTTAHPLPLPQTQPSSMASCFDWRVSRRLATSASRDLLANRVKPRVSLSSLVAIPSLFALRLAWVKTMIPSVTCKRFWLKSIPSAWSPSACGIPIAMPTVLYVTLAVGAQQLAKHKAIVTHITAIEDARATDSSLATLPAAF
ncbi:unnamed protein product, partial [Rhizoctonia solani]